MATMTERQLNALLRFLPAFENPGFTKVDDVEAFLSAVDRNAMIPGWDWVNWGKAAAYFQNPALLDRASLLIVQRLLITHVRMEQFKSGHLAAMIKAGHLQAILRRLGKIAEARTRPAGRA